MLRRGDQTIRVELTHAKALVAALVDGATDLGGVLSLGAGDIMQC